MSIFDKSKKQMPGYPPPLNTRSIQDASQRVSHIENELKMLADTAQNLGKTVIDKANEAESLSTKLNQMREEDAVLSDALIIKKTTLEKIVKTAVFGDRWQGRIEGVVIGFVTGLASSFLVWYFTK